MDNKHISSTEDRKLEEEPRQLAVLIPVAMVRDLDARARVEMVSRCAVIRFAIAHYLESTSPAGVIR